MKTLKKLEKFQIKTAELSSIHGGAETIGTGSGRGYINGVLYNGFDKMTVANDGSWVNVFHANDGIHSGIIGSGRS